jgi:hypothetical protein
MARMTNVIWAIFFAISYLFVYLYEISRACKYETT